MCRATSGDIIGRYERGDIKPSADVVANLSDALEVLSDLPIGKTSMAIDKSNMERIEKISALPDDKKSYVFNIIDVCLRDFKTKKAYAG